jgi:hypothetical protein
VSCYIVSIEKQGLTMSGQIIDFNPPKDHKPAAIQTSSPVLLGRRYQLHAETPAADTHGICGGFLPSVRSDAVLPLQTDGTVIECYLWDSDCELDLSSSPFAVNNGEHIVMQGPTPVASNRFVLSHTSLSKPELQMQANGHELSIRAGFDFRYTPDVMDACLGVINLVESNCFIMLKNGERYGLLNTGEDNKALFLNKVDDDAVQTILQTGKGHETIEHAYEVNVSHAIDSHVDGVEVETMTVLEQYQTFFMQRELPFSEENIWTPACAPIAWGWSMRVARRYDGEWGIARQKLLMPTSGQNGLEMPAWEGNNLNI